LINISVLCRMGAIAVTIACVMPAFGQLEHLNQNKKSLFDPPASELRSITVDASKKIGQLKSLRGVNVGPLPWSDRLELDRTHGLVEVSDRTGFRSLGADASAGYRAANIDLIRVHDNYGPGDIYAKFRHPWLMADGTEISPASRDALVMFPDLQADPSKPENYNFGPTDRLIKSIRDVGAQPLFRLGASANEGTGIPNSFTTNADYTHYSDIAKHVVLHYNKSWNNGFQYGVKYWEVLNEPDGRFDAVKYYQLYGSVARAVKSADPSAMIGGPALMFAYQGPSYREAFLEYLRTNKLPLDFWSFHDYSVDSADPYLFVRIAQDMRKLLDSYGFAKTQIILDEWNILGVDPELLTLGARAAFTASSIIYMQDSPLDAQTLYMGANLFGEDGNTPNKVGQALIALGQMKRTPIRLAVGGADTLGFAVQAGASADGREINIVISNYEVPASLRGPRPLGDKVGGFINLLPRREINYRSNRGFDLKVAGLQANKLYRVSQYRISDNWDYRLLSTLTRRGSEVAVSATLPPPGIELVVIKTEDGS